MKLTAAAVMTLLLVPAQVALAADQKPPPAYGSKDYVWGRPLPELEEILKLSADVGRGEEAFHVCRGCHKRDAAGVASGAYPRLTGQHARVIIKQVTEVRAGVRLNPKMRPFAAEHAVSKQEIADLAVFLAAATTTRESGKGPGTAVARGKTLYEKNGCVTCHGLDGEGDGQKFFPALAAQHYRYLVRELGLIQKGTRGNSHPEMVKAVKHLSPADLRAVADYLSRLPDFRQARAKHQTPAGQTP